MTTRRLLLALLAIAVVCFFVFDLGQYLSLDYLKSQQAALDSLYQSRPGMVIGVFFAVYVAVTALSLPGAAIMTLAAGALFGLGVGTLVVSFASSIGATLAFLVARFILRDTVEKRFGDKLRTFNANIDKDGALYLFTVRLVPVFPFFLVNLVMGLTRIKTGIFYFVSQIGMLAGTLVYVNAGTQLAQIDSLKGILSPGLIFSFVLLGIFPLLARWAVDWFKARKRYEGYAKPDRFDRDMVVIGAGSGGLVTSYIGAVVRAKVTLIERHRMGGDCLNTGCVPSKALIRSAKLMHHIAHSEKYGVQNASGEIDFKKTMARVHEVIAKIEPHDSVERYSKLGVDVVEGEAHIKSPWEVVVHGRTLTTRNIVVATGARPFVPPIPGIDTVQYLTSDNLWDLHALPERLVVLGGGPIGSELAQAFARLGSQVTQVEMADRIMGREDPEISAMVMAKFRADGIEVMTGTRAVAVESASTGADERGTDAADDGSNRSAEAQPLATGGVLVCERDGLTVRVPFDRILVAVGRAANSKGFGLEELGIRTRKNGTLETNDYLQTDFPNIYAVGDVAGPYQFTHTAAHQAWFAAVNSLFGVFKKFRADYRVIPWATFTDPEVARVGLNETEAREQGINYELTTYGIDDLDRAIADSSDYGLLKVLTVPGKDKILGVTMVGEHAGDLISEYVLAMKNGLGLNKILGTIHIYPTLSESNKFAAGEWKKAHQPETVLAWVERFHNWRRGDALSGEPKSGALDSPG